MALETFSYLDSLVVTNPDVNDGLVNGDDHIRGIKITLKNTFPGASGPLTRAVDAGPGYLAGDGTKSFPGFSFTSEGTLGFYRAKPGVIAFAGTLRGTGAVPPGALMDFVMASPPEGWLSCDGGLINSADYPDLFAAIGYTWGGSGAQFRLPNLINRFRRHRDNSTTSGPVGTLQEPMIQSHQHTGATAQAGAHAHNVSGSTGGMDRNNAHVHNVPSFQTVPAAFGDQFLAAAFSQGTPRQITTDAADTNHLHSVTGGTDAQGQHIHGFTTDASGGNETRPYSATVLTCIKT